MNVIKTAVLIAIILGLAPTGWLCGQILSPNYSKNRPVEDQNLTGMLRPMQPLESNPNGPNPQNEIQLCGSYFTPHSDVDASNPYSFSIENQLLTRNDLRSILNRGNPKTQSPPQRVGPPDFRFQPIPPKPQRFAQAPSPDELILVNGKVVSLGQNVIPAAFESPALATRQLSAQDNAAEESREAEPQKPIAASEELAQRLEEQTKRIEAENLSDDERAHFNELLAKVRNWLQKHQQFANKLKTFREQGSLEERRAELEAQLVKEIEVASPDSGQELPQLTQRLQDLQRDLQNSKRTLDEKKRDGEELGRRVTELPALRADAANRLKDIQSKLESAVDPTDNESTVARLLLDARKLATQAENEMLDEESQRQELAGKVRRLESDIESRTIKRLETEIAAWESEVGRQRKRKVEQQARQAKLEAINAHPSLKSLATRNHELTQLRGKVATSSQLASTELAEVNAELEQLVETEKNLRSMLASASEISSANGILLVESRRNLISPAESLVRIRKIKSELQGVNLASIQLKEERQPLADPIGYVEHMAFTNVERPSVKDNLKKTAHEFVQSKREFLDDLISDYENYRGLLSDVVVKRKNLMDQINTVREFIDENALWVRSAEPISREDWKRSQNGALRFFAVAEWSQVADRLADRLVNKPHESALASCGFFALFVFTRRLKLTGKTHTNE